MTGTSRTSGERKGSPARLGPGSHGRAIGETLTVITEAVLIPTRTPRRSPRSTVPSAGYRSTPNGVD